MKSGSLKRVAQKGMRALVQEAPGLRAVVVVYDPETQDFVSVDNLKNDAKVAMLLRAAVARYMGRRGDE